MLSSAVPLLLSVMLASAYTSEHRRLAIFCDEQQHLHCRLPFVGIVFRFRQFSDVLGGIAQRDQGLAIDHDRIKKLLIPGHELIPLRGSTMRTTPRSCAKSRLRLWLWGARSLFLGQNRSISTPISSS
jgi:hypothetical protein